MLPLTTKDPRSVSFLIKEKLSSWRRMIFSDKNSRNLFMFLLLNLSFAFVELIYGVLTNSLGLISDSFHMFFDCTGLLMGLFASMITKRKANDRFSYGYVRAEVLAGFVNSLFLLFISFFILSESVERLIEPPEVMTVFSILNLLNLNIFILGKARKAFRCFGARTISKFSRYLCIPTRRSSWSQPWRWLITFTFSQQYASRKW